jgi:hypothetical protein
VLMWLLRWELQLSHELSQWPTWLLASDVAVSAILTWRIAILGNDLYIVKS